MSANAELLNDLNRLSLRDPPMIKTGGRPSVDWPKLREIWETDRCFYTLKEFLLAYRLNPDTKITKIHTKEWEQKNPNVVQVVLSDADEELEIETVPIVDEDVEKLAAMIRHWRSKQSQSDFILAQKIKDIIEMKINYLLEEDPSRVKSYEVVNLTNALQTTQRIQRLALGMSTENVGVEDARKLAQGELGSVENASDEDDVPTFEVAMNENGKFKRLRPARVK